MSEPEKKTVSVGIDLGTTNSLIAVVGPEGTPEVLPNKEQMMSTPSAVAARPSAPGREGAKYLVGLLAVNNARRDPRNTIRSIKRFMGMSFKDVKVQVAREHVSYEVREDTGEPGRLLVSVGGALLTPEEVSAEILRKVKTDAEARLPSGTIDYVVVTCPAWFSEPQRAATRRAGHLAGLRVKALLDEPTAAALYEGRGRDAKRARILVFDFGGGTLDFSLIQRSGRSFNVVTHGGDNFLGGDDIDRAIAQHIRNHILDSGGEIGQDNLRLEFELTSKAEEVKKALCGGADSYAAIIPGACRTQDGELLDVDLEITQDDFLRLIQPILKRTRDRIEEYLKGGGLNPDQITEVLMVGGSSAVPAVQDLLRDIFEQDGQTRVRLAQRPMEAVALGAAIYANMIHGIICPGCGEEIPVDAEKCPHCGAGDLQIAQFSMDDSEESPQISSRLPWSLGVRYRSGTDPDAYQIILSRGLPYPVTEPKIETFHIPSTAGFSVNILEGDQTKASENRLISVLHVTQIPADVKEGDPVDVGFSFTRDRTLYITLRFPTSSSDFEPRWALKAPGTDPQPNDPVRELTELLPKARRFLQDYHAFIEHGTRKKLQADLADAEAAITSGNAKEAVRLREAIHDAMLVGGGVGSTLLLAEQTIATDHPELGPTIQEAAHKLRRAYRDKDSDLESTRMAVNELVMRALSSQAGIGRGGEERVAPEIIYR